MPRESESRRHESKSDLDRRSRRDGKPGAEKSPSSKDVDQRRRRRPHDALPVESQVQYGPDFKVEENYIDKESDRKGGGRRGGESIRNSDLTMVPRSRDYFQHDERADAGRDGRSSRRRTTGHGSWRDSRDEQKRISEDKERTATIDAHGRHKRSIGEGDANHVWRHDKFLESQADMPPAKKRRPFQEEKLLIEPESTKIAGAQPTKLPQKDHPVEGNERREEKRAHDLHYADRNEHDRTYRGDRSLPSRGRSENASFDYRDRYTGGGSSRYRGLDSYGWRQGSGPGGGKDDKWKHDLFQEANRSPTPKDKEDPIAKVEALLAS